jgi:hypothetical protein
VNLFRRFYHWLYVRIKGHYPLGSLVRFKPGIGFDGIYWKSPGDPRFHAIGIVIGKWSKYKHPMPSGVISTGSVVIFDSEQYDMENWELEVISEAR